MNIYLNVLTPLLLAQRHPCFQWPLFYQSILQVKPKSQDQGYKSVENQLNALIQLTLFHRGYEGFEKYFQFKNISASKPS